MTTILAAPRRHLFFRTSQLARHRAAPLSTLASNPRINVFPHPTRANAHLLTLLPTSPPTASLAIGTTTALPPTPDSLTENPAFLGILHSVLAAHAARDPTVQAQAAAYASSAGAPHRGTAAGGAGGASAQGGAGGAGVGGFVHVADARNPPDWGRIAWSEDIFGSVEVDGAGRFVDGGGAYQASGTYRVCTTQGVLGLSDYLMDRLVERLRELEAAGPRD